MKRFKLFLVAIATLSFTAFYACSGTGEAGEEDTTAAQTEEVVPEPEPEPEVVEPVDTTAAEEADTTAAEVE